MQERIEVNESNLITLIESVLNENSDGIVLRTENEQISYAQLNQISTNLISKFNLNNFERNSPITIISKSPVNRLIGIVSVLRFGGCYQLLPNDIDSKKLAKITKLSGSKNALVDKEFSEDNFSVFDKIINFNDDLQEQYETFQKVDVKDAGNEIT